MMMIMMMMMIISPFGQLGLWAVTNLGCGHLQGCEMYSHKPRMFSHTPVIEESGHPHYGQEAPIYPSSPRANKILRAYLVLAKLVLGDAECVVTCDSGSSVPALLCVII
jgi:hypothetical protein